jgi:hypothetical protein
VLTSNTVTIVLLRNILTIDSCVIVWLKYSFNGLFPLIISLKLNPLRSIKSL